jgi:hypothetical protein
LQRRVSGPVDASLVEPGPNGLAHVGQAVADASGFELVQVIVDEDDGGDTPPENSQESLTVVMLCAEYEVFHESTPRFKMLEGQVPR